MIFPKYRIDIVLKLQSRYLIITSHDATLQVWLKTARHRGTPQDTAGHRKTLWITSKKCRKQ